MRIFAPIVAFTFMASSTLAVSARADEEPQPVARPTSAPAEVPIPQQVPPPPSASGVEPFTLRHPKTVDEFEAARDELEKRLDGVSEEERVRIRKDLRRLDHWFEADTENKNESAVAGGIVMVSLGGAIAVLTGLGLATLQLQQLGGRGGGADEKTNAMLGVALGSGLVVALTGAVLLVYGSPRVMKTKDPSSTTSLFAPSARLLVGPGTMGVGGTF
jgi:hypothetical protein